MHRVPDRRPARLTPQPDVHLPILLPPDTSYHYTATIRAPGGHCRPGLPSVLPHCPPLPKLPHQVIQAFAVYLLYPIVASQLRVSVSPCGLLLGCIAQANLLLLLNSGNPQRTVSSKEHR
jgi:hypothetical protein